MIRCNSCFKEYDESLGMCPFCGYVNGESSDDAFCLSPGTVIHERYIIGQKISSGGFGIVYKAWDKKLENVIAVKEYYPSGLVNRLPGETKVILVASKREREFIYGKTRFLEEARNMAQFSSNKNIVNVYQFFEENNTAYIVMEFLAGRTLSELLQQQKTPLPYDYCINVASEVCAALKAIHEKNILHRDVSPDNIMICNDGMVKLFDFGAARFSAGVENRVTVVVKPGFAPPEQYDKVNRQDARTDIYALGATLYYAMTGVKPEESTNRKIEDTLVEPASIDNSIPQNISTAIMRAMAVEQQYRFANVDEFEKALLNERKVISVQKERTRRRRHRAIGIVLSLLIIAGAMGAFLRTYNAEKDAVGLADANLKVWYIQVGTEEIDQAKENALSSIIQTFTQEYSNVTVDLEAVALEDYSDALKKASESNNVPSIFEVPEQGITDSFNLLDLSELLSTMEGTTYYQNDLGSNFTYPTGIIVPVIYINTTAGVLTEEIAEIDQLVELCRFAKQYFVVKEASVDLYASLFGNDVANYTTATAKEEFINREASIYFGDSSDYFDVQRALPGEYSLVMPNTKNATYRIGSAWSIFAQDEDTTQAASALITYFTSDLAQDYFHIQNHSGCLPIVKTSLPELIDVYDELSPVVKYLSRPFTMPIANKFDELLKNADTSKLDELKRLHAPSFSDVPSDAWYAEAISTICAQDLMRGITETTFEPNSAVSKLDVVTSIFSLAGKPSVVTESPFTDVEKGSEQASALAWASETGIISETADGVFGANNSVNLETVMMLFLRFAEYYELDLSTDVDLSLYNDANAVGSWATNGIRWAIVHRILSVQEGGNIDPKSEVTRGRYSVFLQRLLSECAETYPNSFANE